MLRRRVILLAAWIAASVVPCAAARTETPSGVHLALVAEDNVTLSASGMVERVMAQGHYVFIRDLNAKQRELLPVYVRGQAEIRAQWSVLVTGVTKTVLGHRVLVASRVQLYADKSGRPVPPPPPGMTWPFLPDIPMGITGLSEEDPPVPPDPNSPPEDGPNLPSMLDSLVGTSATLTYLVVSTATGEFSNTFYVQDASGVVNGMRIPYSGPTTVARGDRVSLTGVIEVDEASQEAYLDQAQITSQTTGTPPNPVMMTKHYYLGGIDRDDLPGVNTPSPQGNPYNKGLLVKCIGRVTGVFPTETCFYISDDVNFSDETHTGVSGIRVSWDQNGTENQIVPPQEGWLVAVTGISSSLRTSSDPLKIIRVLRLRGQNDLALYDPQDDTPPTIAITSPSGSTWHVAPNTTSIAVSGTAEDGETCVVRVDVKIDGGQWQPASYNTSTRVWSFTWQNPVSTRFWARATDFAGNQSPETYVDVVISSVGVIHVNWARPNDIGDGLSWATAKKTIQAGVNAASSDYDVWVAAGTYFQCVTHKSGVGLYGGFAGTESVREQRNWARNTSVIDGAAAGHVVTMSNLSGSGTVVDGFTIQNGAASGASGNGGGIYCYYALATVANNIIRANTSGYSGGGLYGERSTLTVVGNVFIENSASSFGGAVALWFTSGQIANNTVLKNTRGGGIFLYSSSPALPNNIIAWNVGGGIYQCCGSSPTFDRNDVYGNSSYDYNWNPPPANDLQVDPGIPYIDSGDWHIWWGSPCRDAGYDAVVLPIDLDVDAQARRNGPIDIGADETTECSRYWITVTSESSLAPIGTPVTVTVYVVDSIPNNHPAAGYQVDVSVDAGEIVSVTRNGTVFSFPPDPPTQSTYGTTGSDGVVQMVVTRREQGWIDANGTITQCGRLIPAIARVFFDTGPKTIGFMHYLMYTGCPDVEAYLEEVCGYFSNLSYTALDSSLSALADCDAVFVVMPIQPLTSQQISSLADFGDRAGKRLVLVGDHSPTYASYNDRLNSLLEGLGVQVRFNRGASDDNYLCYPQSCPINGEHELMVHVNGIWYARTGAFIMGSATTAIAYGASTVPGPWLVEERTSGGGSVVCIHDSNFFGILNSLNFGHTLDTVPDRNFMFVGNICRMGLGAE